MKEMKKTRKKRRERKIEDEKRKETGRKEKHTLIPISACTKKWEQSMKIALKRSLTLLHVSCFTGACCLYFKLLGRSPVDKAHSQRPQPSRMFWEKSDVHH